MFFYILNFDDIASEKSLDLKPAPWDADSPLHCVAGTEKPAEMVQVVYGESIFST